jgi:hypothetical protein
VGFSFATNAVEEKENKQIRNLEDMQMADQANTISNKTKTVSIDGWAVAIALLLAALVRLGLLKHVVW